MEFLYLLESVRNPALDWLMQQITRLGEETAFLVAALVIFWCVDKKKGYYLMTVGFLGTVLNQFLKLAFRVPRPWVLDENFSIVESAREAATGYSFPSGHSQNAVGTFGAIAATTGNRPVRILSVLVCVLVPLSRMYLGVHTPADVLVGAGMALALVFTLRKPVLQETEFRVYGLFLGILVTSAALLLYVICWPFPEDMDVHNLESGMKNAYTMAGCLCGVLLVFWGEKHYVNFSTEAVWWVQVLKVLLGLLLVLAVKEGLRSPLQMLFAGHMAERAVRYFLIVVTAGLLWPMSFSALSKLGVKK